MEWTYSEICDAFNAAEKLAERKTAELFGDKDDLPDDECEIVFSSKLTHDEKLTKLRVLRAGKQVKPKSFAKRITHAGRISAKGLGIRLD